VRFQSLFSERFRARVLPSASGLIERRAVCLRATLSLSLSRQTDTLSKSECERERAGDELIKKCFDSYLGVSCMRLALISRRLCAHTKGQKARSHRQMNLRRPAKRKRDERGTQWQIDERTSYSFISSFSHWPLTSSDSKPLRPLARAR
jgi:hypothetical protein